MGEVGIRIRIPVTLAFSEETREQDKACASAPHQCITASTRAGRLWLDLLDLLQFPLSHCHFTAGAELAANRKLVFIDTPGNPAARLVRLGVFKGTHSRCLSKSCGCAGPQSVDPVQCR